MSQLRESRRSTGPKFFLEVPASSLTRVDKCRTQYFPFNETQMGTAVKGEDRYVPRRDNWKLAIAITLLIACGYGIFLLWSSL